MNTLNNKKEMQQVINYMKAERDRKGRYIPYGEAIALWLTSIKEEFVVDKDIIKELN